VFNCRAGSRELPGLSRFILDIAISSRVIPNYGLGHGDLLTALSRYLSRAFLRG
jgi:hypothetical protein